MSVEQKIRAFLFYLSMAIFLLGLPVILSFSLSYKFNLRTLKFAKAGLIDLKTQPPAANVYLDGKLLNEKTPVTINELLPATYSIKIELDKHYPWLGEVVVEAGKVTRLDRIILFPLRPDVKQVSQDRIDFFWTDKEKIYYINDESNAIYSSNLEGEHFREIGTFPDINPPPKKRKVSPDKEKLLFFNFHQVGVAYLEHNHDSHYPSAAVLLDFPDYRVLDAFWHSDSYHLILITDKEIEALEASPQAEAVTLVNLNKRNTSASYDEDNDTLYFLDSEKAADGKFYDNVYKLELGTKFFPFRDLRKPKPNE